jgi:hypothetical protein
LRGAFAGSCAKAGWAMANRQSAAIMPRIRTRIGLVEIIWFSPLILM